MFCCAMINKTCDINKTNFYNFDSAQMNLKESMSYMCSLDIWFYQQKTVTWSQMCRGAIANVIVSKTCPPYCHVELAFDDGTTVTVLKKSQVSFRKRKFDPLCYNCLRLTVSPEVAVHAKSVAMNRIGEKFAVFNGGVYCSKLVWEILLESKAVPSRESQGVSNGFISPSELYRRLVALGAKNMDWFDIPHPQMIEFTTEYLVVDVL